MPDPGVAVSVPIPILLPETVTVLTILGLVIAVFGLATGLWVLRRQRRLRAHYRAVMTGADGSDLASALETFSGRLARCEQRLDTLEARLVEVDTGRVDSIETRLDDLDAGLRRAVQHVRLSRYSAFADAGGDQSFTLALLDADRCGVVVSGLYGRGGGRVYAKPVSGGASTYNLTDEEVRVLGDDAGARREPT